ncbi:hypothetical protein FQN57_001186 [Myotisia sp. PD_48]|nr:hypothetical protein FQN57_001186 [Myotisia sp. PD_48]
MAKQLASMITFPPPATPAGLRPLRCFSGVSNLSHPSLLLSQRSRRPRRSSEPLPNCKRIIHTESGHHPWPTPAAFFSPTEFYTVNGVPNGNSDHKPPDERIVKLGKTLRILSKQLPTLLIHPLPHEILSPSITLHLFPSTHPHLPTVKGKVAYRAALWTAPVAWGSVPILGNVNLQIMSERMVPNHMEGFNQSESHGNEKLVVRWVTKGGAKSTPTSKVGRGSETEDYVAPKQAGTGRSTSAPEQDSPASLSSNGVNRGLSSLLGGDAPIFKLGSEDQFTGLFIFTFDNQGRISSHTIEHADESTGWDRTAKVVTLTDWLIGKAKGESKDIGPAEPALAVIEADPSQHGDSAPFNRV